MQGEQKGPGRPYRVGLIHVVAKGDPVIDTQDIVDFKRGMETIGYRENVDVVYQELYGNRDPDLIQAHADALVAWPADVIVSFLTNANIALKKATRDVRIPVVCWATNHIEAGLAESYRRPGMNFTGFSYIPYNNWAKVRLLKMAVPGLTRIGHLYNPTYSPAPAVMREFAEAARTMGCEMPIYETLRIEDFEPSILAMKRDGCQAVLVGPHALFNMNGEVLGKRFLDARLPAVGNQLSITRAGGLATISPGKKKGWPMMAQVVDQILHGADPAEIPIDRSMRGPTTLNLKNAGLLGLQLPASLIDEADVLIE
ncbi:MAG: hypothetical protein ABT00_18090 [Bordetella sp. SCN 68-11]|nr:ABC transporter substrate-binding protein [Burkholderiales bacterium]ODU71993.1 MAG: hypothetical protein ABT00_18090 [Bordetella sp. SCN 68-11]OJW92279.1 MAG: hypothetical protein BGO71_07190 [Burkholderiales bacterium 67-32]